MEAVREPNLDVNTNDIHTGIDLASNTIGANVPTPPLQVMRSFTRYELQAISNLLEGHIDRAFDNYPEDFEGDEDVNLESREDEYGAVGDLQSAFEKISQMLRN